MQVDRALRLAIRNFSTLFLTVAVVTVTLHLVYSFFFKDVLAVSHLHQEVSVLSPNVNLQGVGSKDLSTSEIVYWILTAVEIVLIPVFVAAAARVIQVEKGGGVPTVPDAYGHLGEGWRGLSLRSVRRGWVTILLAALIALGIGFFFERAGLLLTEFLPIDWLFLGAGLVRGLSRAVGAPFFLAAVVATGQSPPKDVNP